MPTLQALPILKWTWAVRWSPEIVIKLQWLLRIQQLCRDLWIKERVYYMYSVVVWVHENIDYMWIRLTMIFAWLKEKIA